MATMNLALFSDRADAEDAIHELQDAGYDPQQMSVVMKDVNEAREVADNTGTSVASGAVSGATTGGIIGGIAGLLVGVGAIALPGIGALLIGGPLAAALGLTGAAATTVSGALTGALAGGLVGALIGLGVPEETARVYEERIKEGGVLLAVPTRTANEDSASAIMEKHGAEDVRQINVSDTSSAM